MSKFKVIRLDMGNHKGQDFDTPAQVRKFLSARHTGGPYVLVDKDGHGLQLSKVESLDRLTTKISTGNYPLIDWHPDSGSQWRVKLEASGYVKPFLGTITVADIDAGVDYCGSGLICAIGKAKILHIGTPSMTSTFGNDGFSCYTPLEGPAAGRPIYIAEHYRVLAGHPVGSIVEAGTPLYELLGCNEMGWATSDGTYSLAWATGYGEGQCSIYGVNFNSLMVSLGVPTGHPRGGNAPVGHLPAGWPTF